jgi:beta-galactosidase
VRHLDVARALHGALWRSGIACDVVAADGDLAGYRLVVVPAVYLLSPDGADSLRGYVAGGGHLVVTFCSGIANSAHQVYTGGYPGALRDVLGIRVEEFHPLHPGVTAPLTAADEAAAGSAPGSAVGSAPGSGGLRLAGALGSLWTELLRTDGAAVLARYAEGALAGLPAVTRHRFGAGTAWYVSTLLANEPLERLLRAAATAAGLDGAGAADPPGTAVSRRTDGNGTSWLFAFNHGDAAVTLPADGVDLLSGREVTGMLALAAGDVAVVRLPSKLGGRDFRSDFVIDSGPSG